MLLVLEVGIVTVTLVLRLVPNVLLIVGVTELMPLLVLEVDVWLEVFTYH